MKELKVYRLYFTDSDCYKKGMKIAPSGVQVHSTGANNSYLKRYVGPDDGRLGKNQYDNYHNRPGLTVCANAYIGKLENGEVAIYQTLPWEYCCWLSGSASKGNANKLGYIGFEICEDNKKDKQYFEEAVMHQSVLLTAWLCQTYNIPVDKVHDHNELHEMGLASNHGDIKHWLDLYGLTMNDYRTAVQAVINEGIKIKYMDEPEILTPLYTGIITTDPNRVVNFRSEPKADNDNNIIAKLRPGTEVGVLQKVNESWSQVVYNDVIGYVSNNFIRKKEDSSNKDTVAIPIEELKKIKEELKGLISLIDSFLSENT